MEKKVLIDSEDLYYLILELEQKLGIEFTEKDDLKPEIRIHELIAIATKKIPLAHSSDCTSQHVFYKLRAFVQDGTPRSTERITVQSALAEWMPPETRMQQIRQIEAHFNLKRAVLTSKTWIHVLKGVALVFGIVFCWIQVSVGLLFVFFGWILTHLKGTEFVPQTFGDLVTIIVTDDYRNLRNQKGCFNPNELQKILFSLIRETFGFEEGEIGLETQLSW